jgi:pimeloyl-ACP methyl ester carboxylesterase
VSRRGRWALSALLVVVLVVLLCGVLVYREPLAISDLRVRLQLWRAGVKSEFVDVDGQRIHYLEAVPAKGKPEQALVLIHGLGAKAEDWSPLIPGLAKAGFHVYAPDLLGYGQSARPDVSYSIASEEKLVADFMRGQHIAQADVAGWSMGGWVAMKLAADESSLVNRLVLFDAAGVYFPENENLMDLFDVRDAAGANRLVSRLTPRVQKLPEFIGRDLARRIQRNVWVVRRSMAQMTSGRDLLEFRLYLIQQPTLVVWGKQDELIPLAAGEKIHRGIAGSSLLVLDGCGHLAPSECSSAALPETAEFLIAEPPLRGGEREMPGRR